MVFQAFKSELFCTLSKIFAIFISYKLLKNRIKGSSINDVTQFWTNFDHLPVFCYNLSIGSSINGAIWIFFTLSSRFLPELKSIHYRQKNSSNPIPLGCVVIYGPPLLTIKIVSFFCLN